MRAQLPVLDEEAVEDRLGQLLVELVRDLDEDQPRPADRVARLHEVEVHDRAREPGRLGHREPGHQRLEVHRLAHAARAEQLHRPRPVGRQQLLEHLGAAVRHQEARAAAVGVAPVQPRGEIALEPVVLGYQRPAREVAAGVQQVDQRLAAGRVEPLVRHPVELAQPIARGLRIRCDQHLELGQLEAGAAEVLGEPRAQPSELSRDLPVRREALERRFASRLLEAVAALAAGHRLDVRVRGDLLEADAGGLGQPVAQQLDDVGVEAPDPGAAVEERRPARHRHLPRQLADRDARGELRDELVDRGAHSTLARSSVCCRFTGIHGLSVARSASTRIWRLSLQQSW